MASTTSAILSFNCATSKLFSISNIFVKFVTSVAADTTSSSSPIPKIISSGSGALGKNSSFGYSLENIFLAYRITIN